MRYKLILDMIVLSILSSLVFASDNAPPPIPTEYWGTVIINGDPAANGLAITAEISSIDYTQGNPVTFNNGYYNIMLVGGDRELTYIGDATCAVHWGKGEACVPCSTNPASGDYCIEGPKDNEIVAIKINSVGVMPLVGWFNGSSEEINIVSPIGDWNKNGCVDMGDFVGPFADNYGLSCPCGYPIPVCRIFDLNSDCQIDMGDFVGPFADHYNEGCGG